MKFEYIHGYETIVLLGLLFAILLLKYYEDNRIVAFASKLSISFLSGAMITFSNKIKFYL